MRRGSIPIGSVAGSSFTLRGSRLLVPFTVTGRVKGGRMTGTLTAGPPPGGGS